MDLTDLAECGSDLAECLERLHANAKVATAQSWVQSQHLRLRGIWGAADDEAVLNEVGT